MSVTVAALPYPVSMDAQTPAGPLIPPTTILEPGAIRLNPHAFDADALARYGWSSPTAAARSLGVHSSTLRRAIAGQTAPGERLIVALLQSTGAKFEQLFIIRPNP